MIGDHKIQDCVGLWSETKNTIGEAHRGFNSAAEVPVPKLGKWVHIHHNFVLIRYYIIKKLFNFCSCQGCDKIPMRVWIESLVYSTSVYHMQGLLS